MEIVKKYTDNNNHLVCFDLKPDAKQWQERVRKLAQKETKKVRLKGYRPGKVPYNIAIRHMDLRNILANAAQGFTKQVYDELIAMPEVQNQNILEDSYKINVTGLSPYEITLTIAFFQVPEFTKLPYKKIPLTPDNKEVTDLEINNQLNMLVWKTTKSTAKDAKQTGITNTDLVKINFHGTYNNKPFPGSDGENYEVEMGSHAMLPGFEEQLLGLKKGEKKEFKLKLPKDFFDESLASKQVTFKVEILDIKQMIKTDLTDDFIVHLNIPNVKTKEDIKNFYRKTIRIQKEKTEYNRLRNEAIAYLLENSELNYYPELILRNQMDFFYKDYQKKAKQKHISLEEYVTNYEQTIGSMANLMDIIKKQAQNNIKLMFAIDKIIDDEHIEVTDKDYQKKYEELALENRTTPEQIKKQKEHDEEFQNEVLQEKVFKKVISYNIKKSKS